MRMLSRYFLPASALAFLVLAGQATAQTGTSPLPKDWVQQYDRNGDGKLDREEFQPAIVEAFFFRDKDKNGYLSINELQGASPQSIRAASRKGDDRLSLQEYINALFKDFEAADTDKDGLLTAEEIDVYIRTNRR